MKAITVSSALVFAHPQQRLDAGFWIKVYEEAARRKVSTRDVPKMLAVARAVSATFKPNGLGDLIQRAQEAV